MQPMGTESAPVSIPMPMPAVRTVEDLLLLIAGAIDGADVPITAIGITRLRAELPSGPVLIQLIARPARPAADDRPTLRIAETDECPSDQFPLAAIGDE